MCVCVYIYIYIYREREREGEKESWKNRYLITFFLFIIQPQIVFTRVIYVF